MRASLQEMCERQIQNEAELRKGHKLEFEQIMKLGALMYMNADQEVDSAQLKQCKQVLKSRVGLL